jgi:PAS domain S-box-containing protein
VSLNRKISLGALFFAVVLILGGLAAGVTLRTLTRNGEAIRHTDSVLHVLDTTLALTIDIETATRGFVITGKDEFLEPLNAARDRLPETLQRLRVLTAEDGQSARVDQLDEAIDERLAVTDEFVDIRRTRGLNAAAEAFAGGRGKRVTDRLRGLLGEMREGERVRLAERIAADQAGALRTYRVLATAFSSAIVLVLVATFLLRRGITLRTRRLLRGLERLTAGDLAVKVEPGAQDELGQLASAFNEAVRQRRRSEDALTRAKTLLDGLFQASPLAIVAVDLDGKIDLWNPAAERTMGWSAAEVVGKPLSQLSLHEGGDLRFARQHVLDRCEPLQSMERTLTREDGSVFDASISAAPLFCEGTLTGMMVMIEDVTARKRAREALAESEERFRLAIDEAPIGIALVGLDGRFLRVNSMLCEYVGYSREELTELTFQSITHPDDLATDVALLGKLRRGEIPRYQLGKRYIRKDGTLVDIVLSVAVVRAHDGAPLYYIAQIEDVTDRKRAEEALRRSEEQFRGFIERMPDGVFVHCDRHVVYANPALTTLLDYPEGDALVGKHIAEVYHADDVSLVEARSREIEGGLVVGPRELRVMRRDGTVVSVEGTAIETQFGERSGVLAVFRDLTDRKRAERARDEALQRLRVILDLAPIGIAICTEGKRWNLNRRASELFGCAAERSFDVNERVGALVDSADEPIPLDAAPTRRALRGERVERAEFQFQRPDGCSVPLLVSAAPVPGGEASQPGAVVTFEDITPLKDLERLRSEWSSLIAHDLRQPLSSIGLCADLIGRQVKGNALLSRNATLIRNLTRRMNRMIQDLLDFSRLEARQLTLDRHPVNLVDVVNDVVERIGLEAPDRPIEVRVNGERVSIDADPDRIAQVMENLLTNAIKYGAAGSPIGVSIRPGADAVSVSVTNEGAGIPAEQLPRLFSRFQRASGAKGSVKGIGLGLYITRELVAAHGGQIVAESEPGRVTTFRFTLPLLSRSATATELAHHAS